MILNKFFINVFVRVTFIVLSSVLLGIILQHLNNGFYFTLTGMIFLILIQACFLVNLVNKTNTDLEIFFSSVQDHDSSVRFSEKTRSKTFSRLQDRMNKLNSVIQNSRIENERTSHFLQNLVDHVDAGLLSFDMDGNIKIYNHAVKRYLNTQQLTHLSGLKTSDFELFEILNTIKPGQEVLHKMRKDNILHSVLVRASGLKFENNAIKVVSLKDITNELDKKEMDSWQKIIRVLTHEIMNSISPVTSLTSVISGYFKDKDNGDQILPEKVNHQIISKTLSGLETIEETGKGLLDFVDRYRSLTSLPKPDLAKFHVQSLFWKCRMLMESIIPDNIKIITSVVPEDITIIADYAQIEQVLINLIKNSSEAMGNEKNGAIQLKAFHDGGCTVIQVKDNGTGISNDIIEDIFVPFYTTKKNGSGIGLSLSKQIMQNHEGSISVISEPEYGSTFRLNFNNLNQSQPGETKDKSESINS